MADTPDEIDAIIDDVASGPKQAIVDGRSATTHSLKDLRDHRNDRAAQESASTGKFGLRFSQLVPPGCG